MDFLNFAKKEENKKEEKRPESLIDIRRIDKDFSDSYNKLLHFRELNIDMFEEFVELEDDIKKNSDNKKYIENIKNFFHENEKNIFYLKIFLEDIRKEINKLLYDEVSSLKVKKVFYHYLSNIMISRESMVKTNSGIITDVEVFRYGGDEFVVVITRDLGVELVFLDLMYLNYFNDILGHKGGDNAIYFSSRLIEDISKSFISKTTKTKDIIDKILEEFSNFKFDKSLNVLNKIILHVDIGYSNDGEILEISEKYKKELEKNNIEPKQLSNYQKRDILVNLADIRSSFHKKVSKIFLLASLYREYKKNDNKVAKEAFNGYSAFTKKISLLKLVIEKLFNLDENNKVEYVINYCKNSIIKNYKKSIEEKKDKEDRLLTEVVLEQAIKNINKKATIIDLQKILTKWSEN